MTGALFRTMSLGALMLALSSSYRSRDRFEWRDRDLDLSTRITDSTPTPPTPPAFLFASALDSFAAECACESSPLLADTGQNVTFARAGGAWCIKADETVVNCSASNKARVTKLLDPDGYYGVMMERASTNSVRYSNDLSQAAVWAQVTTTLVKDATGPDGIANSASSATATANGAVFWQTVTASGVRSTSFYIRRKTGTGTIQATREGGAGWHNITASISSTWKRFQPQPCGDLVNCVEASWLSSNFTNPVIGFEVQVNTDSIELAFVQDEALTTWASSPIETGAGAVARNGEDMSFDNPPGNFATVSIYFRGAPFVLGSQNIYPFGLRTAGAFLESRTIAGDGTLQTNTNFPGSTISVVSPVVWTGNAPSTYGGFAFSWDGAAGRACNESTCNASTGTVTLPSTMTGFAIGRNQFISNGYIQGVVNKVCLDVDPDKCLTWAGILP